MFVNLQVFIINSSEEVCDGVFLVKIHAFTAKDSDRIYGGVCFQLNFRFFT